MKRRWRFPDCHSKPLSQLRRTAILEGTAQGFCASRILQRERRRGSTHPEAFSGSRRRFPCVWSPSTGAAQAFRTSGKSPRLPQELSRQHGKLLQRLRELPGRNESFPSAREELPDARKSRPKSGKKRATPNGVESINPSAGPLEGIRAVGARCASHQPPSTEPTARFPSVNRESVNLPTAGISPTISMR